jgi:hypothetical protein
MRRKTIMKKYIPTLIVILLVLGGLEAVALPFPPTETSNQHWTQTSEISSTRGDVLDQSQPTMNWFGPIGQCYLTGNLNYVIAQSFVPTKNLLTRVELMIGKNTTTTYDYTVTIRDAYNGSDLTSVSVPADQILTENFSWIEFDFPDLMVVPGDTYYLVSSTMNATDNWYTWGLNMSDVYLNGTIFYTTDDGMSWNEEPTADMTFNTYGMNGTVLDLTIAGGIGVLVSAKNVGVLTAINMTTTVAITGGILGLIDINFDMSTDMVEPGDIVSVKGVPLGLGPITILATTKAENAAEVSKNATAIVFLIFVILQ